MDFKYILPPKIYEAIDRAGISTSKQIMTLSVWDIKKATNLRSEDVILLKNLIADHVSPVCITCNKLDEKQLKNVPTGCIGIDNMMRGGFRPGSVTEIYGESGSGKTQIALQAATHNWASGTVFICTEDLFPVKRFQQMKQGLPNFNPKNDYGKYIFVEHITEANDLLSCLRIRLPKLLEENKASLVILDSITAPFRCDYTNYVQRAEELREVAILLINIAQKHNLAVLCLNQVTGSFNEETVQPSLGLAWSNMITTRLWLRRTNNTFQTKNMTSKSIKMTNEEQNVVIRELSVVFAPDLPNTVVKLIITSTGVVMV